MKKIIHRPSSLRPAFTLMELLVVIAIIGTLAAMVFPVTKALKIKRSLAVANAELALVETTIESYKKDLGFYPPDNVLSGTPAMVNAITNQLYFELAGTTNLTILNKVLYVTLDGSAKISTSVFPNVYGGTTTVAGFQNSATSARGTDDKPGPINYLKDFRPNQIGQLDPKNSPLIKALVCSVAWPENQTPVPVPANPTLNPWRYVSSSPTNNPGTFDLWVDLPISGKIYRVSNWSKQPQIY